MVGLHPAITRAAALYDETDDSGQLRPLSQSEQDFLTAVSLARTTHSQEIGKVRRATDGQPPFLAVKYGLDADLADELTQALERYDAANEAQDTELEYLLGVVAEEMKATPFAEAAE